MSQISEPFVTIIAGEDLEPHRRVKRGTTGVCTYADAGEAYDYVTIDRIDNGREGLGVARGLTPQTQIESDGAVTAGAVVYGADDGKISATAVGNPVGTARNTATVTDGLLPVAETPAAMPTPPGAVSVAAAASPRTVLATESGTRFYTTGAVEFDLPAATVGLNYEFHVGAAAACTIDPNGTETVALPSTGAQSAAGKHITANAVGEMVRIECFVAGDWNVTQYIGTWTAEA